MNALPSSLEQVWQVWHALELLGVSLKIRREGRARIAIDSLFAGAAATLAASSKS
jgi:hypothetical protein